MRQVEEMNKKITKYVQKESYKILLEFHQICEANDLIYVLDYGTMLGAVRHQGFIPWDDDIDVSMPREDYENFISIMIEKMAKKDTSYFLQLKRTDSEYYLPFAKLRHPNDNLRERPMSHFNIVHGPWIDIFVFDDMPSDKTTLFNNIKKINKKRRFIKYITPVIYNDNIPNQNSIKTAIKKVVINMLKSRNWLIYKVLDKKYKCLSKNIICAIQKGTSNSDRLINYTFPIVNEADLKTNTIYRESFKNRKLVKFEKDYFYIPENYDTLLKDRYGDYLKLPPVAHRKSHHSWDLTSLERYL